MSEYLKEDDLTLCEKCAELYESDKEAYEKGTKILDLCETCFDKYKDVFGEDSVEHETCNCKKEKPKSEYEEIMEQIALEEELIRIENFDKELVIPDYVRESEVFKKAEIEAYAVVNAMRILVNHGIDYQNSMVAASNSITSHNNEKQAKIQAIAQQQATI